MNKNIKYAFLVIFSAILSLTSCAKKANNRSSSSEGPYIRDSHYFWSIDEQEYLHRQVDLVVGSTLESTGTLTTKIGSHTFDEDTSIQIQSTLNYIGDTINSDNSNNAADYLYVNGQKLKKIVSDGSKGVTIDENLFVLGENILTIKIGPYWSTNDYDESKNHGNKWQNCDDFSLTDVHLTLPTNAKLYPTTIVRYYPIAVGKPVSNNNLKTVEEPYDPAKTERLGDGWGPDGSGVYHDSYYGSTELEGRYNIPFKVDFVFNYPKFNYHTFKMDTSVVEDGNYNVALYDENKKLIQQSMIVDNTAPTIHSNIQDNSIVNIDVEKLEGTFSDSLSGLEESYVKIDGQTCEIPCTFDANLNQGKHTILFYAKDKAQNTTYKPIEFYASEVGKFKNYQKTNTATEIQYTSEDAFKTTYYQAQLANVTLKQGKMNTSEFSSLTLPSTTSITDGIPYHSMTFTVSNETTKVFVKYDGGTNEFERYAIKAKNVQTQQMDTLITGYGQEVLEFEMDVTNYVTQNQVELFITNDLVTNGGDTLMWVTDTQHYTKFDDLNEMLYNMMEYCVQRYNSGRAAYFLHTGDLVDDNIVGTADRNLVTKEWQIASRAHKIIEDANMPNGVVTGNHDTSSSLQTLTYEDYGKYFGQDRFNQKPWYGGSLNNNASHYDLVTIADIDFMFVYLGYGVEGDADTIGWANNVIQRYPHRNVVLATHDYLAYNNGNGSASPTSRYNEIFNQIIVPNDNVIMVLCGHDNGAFNRSVNVPNSSRVVHEILSDYQFVDLDPDPSKHKIGSVTGCSGSGFLRELRFTKQGMFASTYSPWFKQTNPFGAAKDNFSLSISYVQNQRLLVSNSIEVYALSSPTTASRFETSQTIPYNSSNKYVVRLEDEKGNYTYELI